MQDEQRKLLYNTVVKSRQLLEEDLTQQLEGMYGIHTDGSIEPLERMQHLDAFGRFQRQSIEAVITHYETGGAKRTTAVARYLRESAFTWLNRLAALKLMEDSSRELIQPAIGLGPESRGFRQFQMVSPEAMRGDDDGGYVFFLNLLFDDLAQAVGPLFDRTLPTSILTISQPCLAELLAKLNATELQDVWSEDETIGWIYQYFTPGELREEARKASSAPRNSYELAFRNQFYTPRYVVAFLADNTLGRLWWLMRNGNTALNQSCRYLIQPDDEVSRLAKRDPRTLRILDPACGSAHFLLYCFVLLLIIYSEAYDDPDLGPALQTDYPNREAFVRHVPLLILQHNLHGIDIDRRAVQIASLALWLRAQRAWADLGVKRQDRSQIDTIHIVCAEPMPGEYDVLGDFVKGLEPKVLGNLLLDLWTKMRLAGEAGSLLKIEQEMQFLIGQTREKLKQSPVGVQMSLYGQQPTPTEVLLPSDLPTERFWQEVDERVVTALRDYVRHTISQQDIVRHLFAIDAQQGIAFITLLLQPFDVVLMNPPFGAASKGSKQYIHKQYPRTKNDLYAAFVERGLELLQPGGYLGAITSRTGFFLTSFRKWREEILLQESDFIAMADLGYGVLDTAMVETAAYVLSKAGDGA